MMLMLPADKWDMCMPSMLLEKNAILQKIDVGKLRFIALGVRVIWKNVLTPHT
jgi:hypothetical protein